MKKTFFALFIALFSCLNMFSQATSMTIDCQNPGWLSSMINYGDQQTLENIKVTGYINATDLSFLGSLNTNQKLNGVVDLEDVQIVGATSDKNNILKSGFFSGYIRHLILPKALVDATECLNGLTLDSLTFGGESLPSIIDKMFYRGYYAPGDGSTFNRNVKHLILREGINRIEKGTFYNHSTSQKDCVFESISFPNSMKEIGYKAFYLNYKLRIEALPDSLEVIDEMAFQGIAETPDTLRLPKGLRKYHTTAFSTSSNQLPNVLYFSENIDTIDNVYEIYASNLHEDVSKDQITSSSIITIHLAAKNPPKFIYCSDNCLKNSIIYVPKQSITLYSNTLPWKNATLLAEPTPLEALTLTSHEVLMGINSTYRLSCSFIPSDASNKNVTWNSSDNNVATVSNGIVSAKAVGEAYIYVISNENPEIKDSCLVNVVVPVEGITISQSECTLAVGNDLKLETAINPANATNKKVLWDSSNESVCTVKDGIITAIAKGISIITATTEEGKFRANCTVTVVQPVTNITLDHNTFELHGIGASGKLTATVEPEDASNKDVTWKSSNESVCVVSNGTIIAVGYGEAVIIATSVDGGHMAICSVKVDDKTLVKNVDAETSDYKVYNLQGIEKTQLQKGINIIRFKDGTSKKVLVK